MPTDPSQRQARSRQAHLEAGGRIIGPLRITPAAADKLARWVTRGLTVTQVVNKLLERSKP